MESLFPQLILLAFLAAIGLVAYDMRAALRPPVCPECQHCQAARAAQERVRAEVEERYDRQYGWRHRDRDDRR